MDDGTDGRVEAGEAPKAHGSSKGGSAAATGIQITAASKPADVLAALRRQGISDLDDLVKKLVAEVKEKAEEEHGEDDDVWRANIIVHDHYAMFYGGVQTAEAVTE